MTQKEEVGANSLSRAALLRAEAENARREAATTEDRAATEGTEDLRAVRESVRRAVREAMVIVLLGGMRRLSGKMSDGSCGMESSKAKEGPFPTRISFTSFLDLGQVAYATGYDLKRIFEVSHL